MFHYPIYILDEKRDILEFPVKLFDKAYFCVLYLLIYRYNNMRLNGL